MMMSASQAAGVTILGGSRARLGPFVAIRDALPAGSDYAPLVFSETLPICPVAEETATDYAAVVMIRLDYLSCVLTVVSTVLVGKKLWHGWVVAALNSVVICLIGVRTAQFGFVPANLFCLGLYANNLSRWLPKDAGRPILESRKISSKLR